MNTALGTLQLPTPRRLPRAGRGAAARRPRGFIMGYLMTALIILGIITAALSRIRDEQASAEWVDRAQSKLRTNVQIIRSQVLLCAATSTSDVAGLVAAMPQSADDINGDALESVQCTGTGQRLFDGTNTVFLPRPPEGFTPWAYVNDLGASGTIFARTSTSDSNGVAAVNRLSRTFGTDEMSVTTAGGTTTLTYFLRRPAATP
jgi:hypothetical protein